MRNPRHFKRYIEGLGDEFRFNAFVWNRPFPDIWEAVVWPIEYGGFDIRSSAGDVDLIPSSVIEARHAISVDADTAEKLSHLECGVFHTIELLGRQVKVSVMYGGALRD